MGAEIREGDTESERDIQRKVMNEYNFAELIFTTEHHKTQLSIPRMFDNRFKSQKKKVDGDNNWLKQSKLRLMVILSD